MDKLRISWIWLTIGAVVFPFLLIGSSLFIGEPREYELNPISDLALLEVGTINAANGTQLLGPFSRFGWNHPGPALFYALAPFYLVFGKNQAALALGALAINLAAALIMLHVSIKLGGRLLFISTAIFLLLTICFLRTNTALVWNPVVTILPFGALLYLSAAVSLGRLGYLPLAAVVTSFVVQTHIAYIPTVVAIVITSITILTVRYLRRNRSEQVIYSRNPLVWILMAAILSAVLWWPVLLEEFTNNPGNLSKMAAFFSRDQGHSLQEALGALAGAPIFIISKLFRQPHQAMVEIFGLPTLAIQLLLLLGVLWVGVKRKMEILVSLSLICLTALTGALLSATRIVGTMQWYLLFWTSIITIIILAMSLAAVLHLIENRNFAIIFKKPSVVLAILILILAVAWAAWEFSYVPTPDEAPPGLVQYLSEKIAEYIRYESLGKPEIKIVSHTFWGESCGVILRLAKNRIPFGVSEVYINRFGKQYANEGEPDYEIHFCDAEALRSIKASSAYRFIAEFKGLYVFAVDMASIRSRIYTGPISISAVNCKGNPDLVTDGSIPKFGIEPDTNSYLFMTGAESSTTLKLPDEKVKGFEIYAPARDLYAVSGSTDGSNFFRLGTVFGLHGRGLQSRLFFSDRLPKCSYLRISPLESEGVKAIAEIRLILSED